MLFYQVILGITNQRRYYRDILKDGPLANKLPDRSRFNRLCNRAKFMLFLIWKGLIQDYVHPKYTVIDSLPMPLCIYVRDSSVKVFRKYANYGYNSTKRMHFYGFKGSFMMSDNNFIVACDITKASLSDIKMVTNLIQKFPTKRILADKGYLSRPLQREVKSKYGTLLWTPKRKNMSQYSYDDTDLRRRRRRIETKFNHLCNLFDIEHNRARSLKGFYARLYQCLMADTMLQL